MSSFYYPLSVYNKNMLPPPNKYMVEFVNNYYEPISKLSSNQQKHIKNIAKLFYKAGKYDGERNRIQIKKYNDEDDDDE